MTVACLLLTALLQTTGAGSPEAELLALEKVWNQAHLRGDAAALEGLWADDLIVTVPKMPVLTRDDAVRVARSGVMRFQRYDSSDTHVRIYSSTAIVTGKIERVRERDGQVVTDHWQFTKVYVRQDGKWKVIAFHASDAPDQR
ncbi:MAG: nuclear transport factor 2 family protein [Acidobacteriota bacterium]